MVYAPFTERQHSTRKDRKKTKQDINKVVEKPDSILHKLVKKEVQKQRKIYVDVKVNRLYQANVSQKKRTWKI